MLMKAMFVITLFLVSVYAHATIKCAPDSSGGMCCWDVDKDGPWKPITC